jgi:TP53 regulating kinase-like protein
VFRVTFLQRDAVAKQRFSKKYRHPDLDARLTKQRLQGVRVVLCSCLATRLLLLPQAWLSHYTACATPPRQEARALLKARRLGVATPVVYNVDTTASCLYLEFVGGPSVKQHLRETTLAAAGARPRSRAGLVFVPAHAAVCDSDLAALAHKIGRAVATLHDGGLVHGDLTTSNMIIREEDQQLVRLPPMVQCCIS